MWACLLAEAGLRSPATAALLVNSSPRPWAAIVGALPKTHQWAVPNFIPDSFYADCLALAHSSDVQQHHLQLVEYFRRLKAPGNQKLLLFHARFLYDRFRFIALAIYFGASLLGSVLFSSAIPDIKSLAPDSPALAAARADLLYKFLPLRSPGYCAVNSYSHLLSYGFRRDVACTIRLPIWAHLPLPPLEACDTYFWAFWVQWNVS
jgi:hypothetical protein